MTRIISCHRSSLSLREMKYHAWKIANAVHRLAILPHTGVVFVQAGNPHREVEGVLHYLNTRYVIASSLDLFT